MTQPDRLREAVHRSVERIVEHELTGIPAWRYDLANRLTDAAIAALATDQPDLIAAVEALPNWQDEGWDGDPSTVTFMAGMGFEKCRAAVVALLRSAPAPDLRESMQREIDSGWAVDEVLRRHGIRAPMRPSDD